MPITKSGDKYKVNDEEFDTQELANEAYMKYINKAMGADMSKGMDTKKTKKKPKQKS